MCVIPVSNHICKHTTRRSALLCEKANRSHMICEDSPDLVFDEPFKCTPCYDGVELRLASDQGKPRAYTSTDLAAVASHAQTAERNGVQVLTAAEDTGKPENSSPSQQIYYEYYDQQGRRLKQVRRNNPQLQTPTTEKASSERGDSTPSPQGLSYEDQFGLQLDGTTDDHDETPQEAGFQTAQQVHRELLGDSTSPPSSSTSRIDASASGQHNADDAPAQATPEPSTPSVPTISVQVEAVLRTETSADPESTVDAEPPTESSLSSNAEATAQTEGHENVVYSSAGQSHAGASAQAEQAHQEEQLHTAAILLINFSRHGLAETASPADPGNRGGVLIPSAAEVRHSASVLIRIAQQCLEAIGAASGDDSNEDDEPVAPADAAVEASDDEEIRNAAATLVSLSQQAHEEAAQVLLTATAEVAEDKDSTTEEDTEEDSEETQAYLQRVRWRNNVMNEWPRDGN